MRDIGRAYRRSFKAPAKVFTIAWYFLSAYYPLLFLYAACTELWGIIVIFL